MHDTDSLADVARLLGERARMRMVAALLGGCAFTGKELAYFAGVTAATASSHLSRLVAGELLAVEKQGRFHYYRLKSAEIARAIEGLSTVTTAAPPQNWPPSRRVEPALREARMCYDHMAGRLGVSVCDMMVRRRYLVLLDGVGHVTEAGVRFLTGLGVDLDRAGAKRRSCRSCLDWTERRPHVSGGVGAALADAFLEHEWIARIRDSRVLRVTPDGRKKLMELGVADTERPAQMFARSPKYSRSSL